MPVALADFRFRRRWFFDTALTAVRRSWNTGKHEARMKILSATVFLSLGMAIGTAISAVAGANAAGPDPGIGEARFVEPQPLLIAEVEQAQEQVVNTHLAAEAGGAH